MWTRKTILGKVAIPLLLISTGLSGQDAESWKGKPQIFLKGYIDVYYSYDFNQPDSAFRQTFFYHHNRHNEFNINQMVLGIAVEHQRYRAHLSFHTGNYPTDNYALEPQLLQFLFDAYIGVSLNRRNNLWLDAGVFPSHLGGESALSIDNWTLTRSLYAESSPYFLTGVKVTYQPFDQLEVAGLVVNGWQRIRKVQNNTLPSFGTQVVYAFGDDLTLNWGTFIGTDDPDSTRRMRYFSDLYVQWELTDKLGLFAGFDIGMQQDRKGSSSYQTWYVPTLIARYNIAEQWAMAIRGEYYHDANEVIISADSPDGFRTFGWSANLDFRPLPNLACRIEGRWLNSRNNIFYHDQSSTRNDVFFVASIAYKLNKEITE